MRDVLLVQRGRVLAARRVNGFRCETIGRDERVEFDGYAEQQPGDVAWPARDAAALSASVLARLGRDDWERAIVYHYPEWTERSLRWLAVHTMHEMGHHLLDVQHQLDGPQPQHPC